MTVSAVIPAYGAESTIVETLDSILAQTIPVHEIIVVDDVSPDDTVSVVRRWAGRVGSGPYSARRATKGKLWEVESGREGVQCCITDCGVPLRLVQSQTNGGPAAARNMGIGIATGEWIAFLDSDDAWLPEKTAVQVATVAENPGTALVCGRTVPLVDVGSGKWEVGRGAERELSLADFVAHNPVATSTVMARRDVLLGVGGFDGQFCGPEDYDLWLRVVAEHKCLELDVPLTRYRSTVGSLSMDERKFLPQVLRVLKKAFGPGGALEDHQNWRSRSYAEQYASAAWMAYNRGANGVALRYLLRSWLYDMRRLEKEQADPLLRLKLLFRYVFRCKPDVLESKAEMGNWES